MGPGGTLLDAANVLSKFEKHCLRSLAAVPGLWEDPG